MFKSKIVFIVLLLSFLVLADEDPLIGTWNVEVKPTSDKQFPFWREIKYPKKLVVSKSGKNYKVLFTDQYGYECETKPMSTNRSQELIFTFCSGLGTKSPLSWSPIHHAKIVDGKLHGVVTSNRFLFEWVGDRQQ